MNDVFIGFIGTDTGTSGNHPNHWTKDMIQFYNDDWGGEDEFIVEQLQRKMDKNPSLWIVSKNDSNKHNSHRRKSKCGNCMCYGHQHFQCPDPLKVPSCHMCGEKGHIENNCPESKCLNVNLFFLFFVYILFYDCKLNCYFIFSVAIEVKDIKIVVTNAAIAGIAYAPDVT